jgi:hypothetical protein
MGQFGFSFAKVYPSFEGEENEGLGALRTGLFPPDTVSCSSLYQHSVKGV